MRVLVATDAWHPQINGVVRTLTALRNVAAADGNEIVFLTPADFQSVPLPGYPEIPLALPRAGEVARRIEALEPDAIHLATEGPVGWSVRRGTALREGGLSRRAFTRACPNTLRRACPCRWNGRGDGCAASMPRATA